MAFLRSFFLYMSLVLMASASFGETRLMMVERHGCHWCEKWVEQIGPIYPKTPEGQAAPLLRVDINAPLPDGVSVERTLIFTPTFVLLQDGQEIWRMEGYNSEDFFWGLLGDALQKNGLLDVSNG